MGIRRRQEHDQGDVGVVEHLFDGVHQRQRGATCGKRGPGLAAACTHGTLLGQPPRNEAVERLQIGRQDAARSYESDINRS